MIHASFSGRLVMLGFGSIGQGVLPLILRHIAMPKSRITIVTAEPRGREVAEEFGVRFVEKALTRDNHKDVLVPLLGRGDFLLNLSVDVSSVALVELAQSLGALYLDTCVEPWAGGYTDPSLTPSQRSNYALRESALALRGSGRPTAVMTHGANPGLVSHFVKQALLNIAGDTGVQADPKTREEWAALAAKLNVKVIHIAERDTQTADIAKRPGEFVNTWSIDGFVGEGNQPAELGWGTHERALPPDGALRLPPLRRRGALPPRAGGQELGDAAREAADDGRDRARHGRARRAADGPREGRLLVRLAPLHRGGAAARAAQQRHLAAGDGGGAGRAGLGH